MPVIRVSEETLERLRKWAIPLKDSMDSALKKAMSAAEEYQRSKGGELFYLSKDAIEAIKEQHE